MQPWWPRFIVKPRVRLTRPRFGMPTRPPDTVLFGLVFIAVIFVLGTNSACYCRRRRRNSYPHLTRYRFPTRYGRSCCISYHLDWYNGSWSRILWIQVCLSTWICNQTDDPWSDSCKCSISNLQLPLGNQDRNDLESFLDLIS